MLQNQNHTGSVYIDKNGWEKLKVLRTQLAPSKIFILTDTNTNLHCLPYFLEKSKIVDSTVLTMSAGESHKTIETCIHLWNQLSDKGADRNSLLINLGGGVVTDLGGFVACTYQRGIAFINIPTSLLAMVDASIGGKNGVDLGFLKNQVGIIKNPEMVIVDTEFLQSLPDRQIKSGMAEMLKHGFIASEKYLDMSFDFTPNQPEKARSLIWESIQIKGAIIEKDPYEKGIRKHLNFGHTLGHAIESFTLGNWEQPLLHGESIAIGMILACYISSKIIDLPIESTKTYASKIADHYPTPSFSGKEIEAIIKLLIYDKKNSHGKVQFVLLNRIGQPKVNCIVPELMIKEAFNFYNLSFTE